jgi:hypothetical protein
MGISELLKKQIANATPPGGGVFLKDGIYTLAVKKIVLEQMHTGMCFIVEFKVVAVQPHPNYPDVKPNAVDTTASSVWNFTKHADTAPGNTKGFLAILEGVDASTLDANTVGTLVDAATGPDQPYKGYLVGCETYRKYTKGSPTNPSKELTLPKWQHIPEDGDNASEMVQARAKDL